jgi:hypothetical protein
MQARQTASSLSSVYAVGISHDLLVIERGPDGLWGWWRATGHQARRIAHGGSIIACIGVDDRVAVLQRYPDNAWFVWDRQAAEVCTAHLPGRGPVLFAADAQVVSCTWKEAPSAPWRAWEPLGGPVTGIDATAVTAGGLALAGIRDGAVLLRWQDRSSVWRDWSELPPVPGGAQVVRLGNVQRGGVAAFAIGGDRMLYHTWQDEPSGRWHPWGQLGGAAKSLSVTRTPAGGLAVFMVSEDDAVGCRYQAQPFGEWSGWVNLGWRAQSLSAQPSFTDGLEVFAVGTDLEVVHNWCERLDLPWSGWTPLEHEASHIRAVAAAEPPRPR